MSGGVIPANLFGLRHPVMMLQLLFRTKSTCRACAERDQSGHAYSAAEKLKASADVLMACGLEPYCEQVSLRKILFPVFTLALQFWTCFRKIRERSRVTPRYFECGQFSNFFPCQKMLSGRFASLFF